MGVDQLSSDRRREGRGGGEGGEDGVGGGESRCAGGGHRQGATRSLPGLSLLLSILDLQFRDSGYCNWPSTW